MQQFFLARCRIPAIISSVNMLASSTTIKLTSLHFTGVRKSSSGLSPSALCTVLALKPVLSVRFLAAFPVGAHSTVLLVLPQQPIIALISVVLPVPAPPVINDIL